MHVVVKAFWLPKAGNTPDEYEDAYWPSDHTEGEYNLLRLAVADGATETSFAAQWAGLLVRSYGSGEMDDSAIVDRLVPLQELWQKEVESKALNWYAVEKLRYGAFATLLGLTLYDSSPGSGSGLYRLAAIGDSCFFHIRSGRLIDSFPLHRVEQFTSRPALISSVAIHNALLNDSAVHDSGEWQDGDVFYLMTDALACWFLGECGSGLESADVFGKHDSVESFSRLVNAERSQRTEGGEPRLKNDDVTLIRCSIVVP